MGAEGDVGALLDVRAAVGEMGEGRGALEREMGGGHD